MGQLIHSEHFSAADYERFQKKLRRCLDALALLLARGGFGEGPATIGAELEVFLVDAVGAPLPINQDVLAWSTDKRLTLELARFNLECNCTPVPLAGRPFSAVRKELDDVLGEMDRSAAPHGGHIVPIGILPTVTAEDLGRAALSDAPRYHALSRGLLCRRGGDVPIHIEGEETLDLRWPDLTLEGANTSFQVHLRVPPRDFARAYNAAQLATAPVLAVSGNSPLFFGRRLWDETRIPLFQQSSDDRDLEALGWDPPRRVSFGHGWLRAGALELFEEVTALHPAILPVVSEEDPLEVALAGGVPRLDELALHNGTVWRWNRAVYGSTDGGHVRIELRALPSGPTLVDMMANAALHLGLTLALMERIEHLLPAIPFPLAAGNFYRAARDGLDALLAWPQARAPSPEAIAAPKLVEQLLPFAREGLLRGGVDAGEADLYLDVVAKRVQRGVTGARWQRRALAELEKGCGSRQKALPMLLERYLHHVHSQRPVHEWPVP